MTHDPLDYPRALSRYPRGGARIYMDRALAGASIWARMWRLCRGLRTGGSR